MPGKREKAQGNLMIAPQELAKKSRSVSEFSSADADQGLTKVLVGAPSSRCYAQINVQLYEELREAGYDDLVIHRVKDAYGVAQRLFAAQFRGSGRPFLAHLVGTASILVKHGAAPDVVIAGLLHAAYQSGDFGFGIRGMTAAKRQNLSRLVDKAVEMLVARYTVLAWTPDRISEYAKRGMALTPQEHDVLFMRLANELEDALEDNFVHSGSGKQRSIEQCLPASAELADALGLTALAGELRLCCEVARMPSKARPWQTVANNSYALVPASCRLRVWPWLVRNL